MVLNTHQESITKDQNDRYVFFNSPRNLFRQLFITNDVSLNKENAVQIEAIMTLAQFKTLAITPRTCSQERWAHYCFKLKIK